MTIGMPVEPEANELLTRSPLALLIGMVLDQQVPLERAFSAPLDLVRRLGHEPTAAELAEFDPDALAGIFSERPALHRYPKAMATRVQDLARPIVEQYDGEAEQVWGRPGRAPSCSSGWRRCPGSARRRRRSSWPCSASSSGCGRPAGGGGGGVRRRGVAVFGRGHHRRRVAGPGAVPQAGPEGRRQGRADVLSSRLTGRLSPVPTGGR